MGEEETYLYLTESDHPTLVPLAQIECIGVCVSKISLGLAINSEDFIEKCFERQGRRHTPVQPIGRPRPSS